MNIRRSLSYKLSHIQIQKSTSMKSILQSPRLRREGMLTAARSWLRKVHGLFFIYVTFYTLRNEVGGGGGGGGGGGCHITFRVRPVAFTVQDRLFPYLVQMINSMRGCVACDDPWPWPISSRSFDLDFENCVLSVTFSVLDWLFPYLPQIITTIRRCVAC